MSKEETKRIGREERLDVQDVSLESSPDRGVDQRENRELRDGDDAKDKQGDGAPEPAQVVIPTATSSVEMPRKDPVLIDVENLLADDLTDLFLSLPDEKKWAFKQKGEETASKIKNMIQGGKLRVKTVFDLIREWLKMVPGVSKYFLEQEAKIKADKVLQYAKNQENLSKTKV